MLCELPYERNPYSALNLSGSNGWLLVVLSKLQCLAHQFFKYIIDEVVHDSHGLVGNTNMRVDLLENLEDIDLVGLHALLMPFLTLLVFQEVVSPEMV